jgi:hypothetical protein
MTYEDMPTWICFSIAYLQFSYDLYILSTSVTQDLIIRVHLIMGYL